jgi:F-type H+-transporting ATPase subunit c
MDATSLKFIGVGLMAFGMLGSAIGVGMIFQSLLDSIARNPSASDQLQRFAFIGAGLAEAMGLFSFVIAMLILFAV